MSEQTAEDQNVAEQDVEAAEAPADNVRQMDRAKKVDQAKKKVATAVGEAREKFQHVAADVGERFQQASATAQEEFRERSKHARQQARERYQVASEQMHEGYARVRKDVDVVAGDVNDFVRQNPGTAVLIAAGAGFLLGLLMRPRQR